MLYDQITELQNIHSNICMRVHIYCKQKMLHKPIAMTTLIQLCYQNTLIAYYSELWHTTGEDLRINSQ